jgi:formylglycine-generating enzyme required for sulfatase activity
MMESATALREEPVARASAGRALGVLGDPRPGVGVRDGLPDILWVPITGTGPQGCKLGNGTKPDAQAYDDETWPEHKARLVIDGFELAAYPVTVAQYECFVREGGYQTEAYWSEAGWQAVGRARKEPRYWQDRLWHQANHPVVGVSVWEAEAFCRWLGQRLNRAIRLPTEAEWEWAARGRTSRRYPWGDDWDALRANTWESEIRRTTPVGLYPAGAVAGGQQDAGGGGRVYDLAGNVWEWIASAYSEDYADAHELTVDKQNTGRVLRGGSWGDDPSGARAAGRNYSVPGNRGHIYGFRVVCAFPIVGR